jgi:hypothetical protein
MLIAELIATVAAGLFAGAAAYVTVAEHPARLECGQVLAVKEFGPSYRRAAVMQGALAVVGFVAGSVAWYDGAGTDWLVWGLLLGALVPYTLVIIMPTNRRLLDPTLDAGSGEARALLVRWGRLHAVRTVVGIAAFVAFVGLLSRS